MSSKSASHLHLLIHVLHEFQEHILRTHWVPGTVTDLRDTKLSRQQFLSDITDFRRSKNVNAYLENAWNVLWCKCWNIKKKISRFSGSPIKIANIYQGLSVCGNLSNASYKESWAIVPASFQETYYYCAQVTGKETQVKRQCQIHRSHTARKWCSWKAAF